MQLRLCVPLRLRLCGLQLRLVIGYGVAFVGLGWLALWACVNVYEQIRVSGG
jgi:hypothetical protein